MLGQVCYLTGVCFVGQRLERLRRFQVALGRKRSLRTLLLRADAHLGRALFRNKRLLGGLFVNAVLTLVRNSPLNFAGLKFERWLLSARLLGDSAWRSLVRFLNGRLFVLGLFVCLGLPHAPHKLLLLLSKLVFAFLGRHLTGCLACCSSLHRNLVSCYLLFVLATPLHHLS